MISRPAAMPSRAGSRLPLVWIPNRKGLRFPEPGLSTLSGYGRRRWAISFALRSNSSASL
jgi:hypothetical protein